MTGKLTKQGSSWYVVRLEENEWETYYRVHPDQESQLVESDDKKTVNFIRSELPEYVKLVLSYAEMERKLVIKETTWDEIFDDIEKNLHEDLPIRVKNYLKNSFTNPLRIN